MKSILQNIWEKYSIQSGDMLIVGVSGGVDSMVLIESILGVHPKKSVIICHIDHGMRDTSKEDLAFVQAYSKRKGVRFESTSVKIEAIAKQAKISTEMAGREVRYGFFEKLRQSEGARFVITAHHQNDSVETLFLNLIKGARLRGLTGIQERKGTLLRPLLSVTKKEILNFAEKEGISFRDDITNSDNQYQRNRIRNTIIPECEAINPECIRTLSKTMSYFKGVHEMMEGIIGVHLAAGYIEEKTFENMSPLLRHTLVEYVYASISQTTLGLNTGNIEEIERFILTARGGTKKIIGNLHLEKKNRKVIWMQEI